MSLTKEQDLHEHLQELSLIIKAYNPSKTFLKQLSIWFGILAIQAIFLIVIAKVGLFFGLILLGLALIPIVFLLAKLERAKLPHTPTEEELAERACQIMSHCVNLYKYQEGETARLILNYSTKGNLPLYKEFISIYPQMASKKLESLASVSFRAY